MAGARRIVIEFIGKDVSAGKEASAVEKRFGSLGGKLDKVGRIAGKALAGGLLMAGAAAVKMTQAAAEDAEGQAKLATVLQNTTGATKAQVAAVEEWIGAQGKALGIADDELRPALAQLVGVTNDVGKAQKDVSLAMDVSAATGKSFESIISALVRAEAGQVSGLSRLGIETKDAHGKTKSLNQITKDLAETYGGSAAAAADTAAGKQKRMTLAFSEFQEELGAKLLPVMAELAEKGIEMIGWVEENQEVVGTLVVVVGTLTAGLWAASKAAAAYAAVMALNPFGLAVVASAAAVAGIVALTKATRRSSDAVKYSLPKWDQYTDTLDGVTAATSRATREMVLQRLEEAGLLEQTRALGVADRDAVQAVMGNEAARKRLAVALGQATNAGKSYQALQVANRMRIEAHAIESSRVRQLKKNLALAATREEAQRIQNKLDKLARTDATANIRIAGTTAAINDLTAIQQLIKDVTRKRGGNAQVPGSGSVLGILSGGRVAEGAGATGAIVNRPTVALIGEDGPEALIPLERTRGNSPLPAPTGTVRHVVELRLNGRTIRELLLSDKVASGVALGLD